MKNRNIFILIFILLCFLNGQNFAQWQLTNLPDSVKVNALVMCDSNLYTGTYGSGILESTDNGENWKSINSGLSSNYVYTIYVSETSQHSGKATIFAGTDAGASISTDNGLTWSTISSGLSGLGVWSFAVNISITGDTTIFAGTQNGIYSSNNNGKEWHVTGLSNTTMPVNSMVVYNNHIFASALLDGLYLSDTNGQTWKDISFTSFDPDNGAVIIEPVTTLIKFKKSYSTDILACTMYGRTFTWNDYKSEFIPNSKTYPYKSYNPILCYTDREDTLFAGGFDGYIYTYNFYKLEWAWTDPPLWHNSIYAIVMNGSYIFAGTDDGIWRLRYPEAITGIESLQEVPSRFELEQNYPNPFNPKTIINYKITNNNYVTLKVYNLLGNLIKTLVNGYKSQGSYSVIFDGSDLPSGVYFYSLEANGSRITRKLILMK